MERKEEEKVRKKMRKRKRKEEKKKKKKKKRDVEEGDAVVEAARLRAMTKLTRVFEQNAAPVLGGKWLSFLCEFIYGATTSDGEEEPRSRSTSSRGMRIDVVIPSSESMVHGASRFQLLRNMLVAAQSKRKLQENEVDQICENIARGVRNANDELQQRIADNAMHSRDVVVERECIQGVHKFGSRTVVRLTCAETSVEIGEVHEQQLRARFQCNSERSGGSDADIVERERAFRRAAFCCIARYLASIGGLHRFAGGFHAALHPKCFELLHTHLEISCECFASPLNVSPTSSSFCSIYADLDAAFGSKGSFFDFYPQEGSFECNPPFIDRIVGRMLTHIEGLLSRAEASGLPLSFTIIVKKDRDAKNWQRIRSSRYKIFDMTLWQGEHGYCEGAAFARKRVYRPALHDSSFFILQTKPAAAKWSLTEDAWNEIKAAFAAPLADE